MRVTLDAAAQLLHDGQVVAVPTETVYGLAAALNRPSAIEKIFTIKGRPSNNPLIIHISSPDDIQQFTSSLPPNFLELSKAFWPGPLTLVMPVNIDKVPGIVRAELPTAAFRIPNHPLTRDLLQRVGPLVMPSANLSGRPSATQASHVENDFGTDFPVLDGGVSKQGVESTILVYNEGKWQIVRLGALPPEIFLPILGYLPEIVSLKPGEKVICPGQLFRHYAPRAKMHLCGNFDDCRECVVGFSDRTYQKATKLFLLGPSDEPEVIAENLYAVLRQLDDEQVNEVWVDKDFPMSGLWLTIAERLDKAACRKYKE